ncbi:MAG: PxKF domain-containing protein [Ilumatobacteraceae bacterium]
MNGVGNTVKAGSTVPLKFEVFAGTELTTTEAIDATLTVQEISCTNGVIDAIEVLSATGGTLLRYDTASGQFIQNWNPDDFAGLDGLVEIIALT